MATQALTVQPAQALLPTGQTWKAMQVMAADLLESGFLPSSVTTWQAALAIIQKGTELGIPPMQALGQINVIKGKPCCSAELMLALIYRDQGDDAIRITRTDAERCDITYKRRNWREEQRYSFTTDDAKTAKLGGDNWTKYAPAMLRARCISAVARMAFADSIGGMYTPEEMGATVTQRDDGVLEVVAFPQDERVAHESTMSPQAKNVTPPVAKQEPPPIDINAQPNDDDELITVEAAAKIEKLEKTLHGLTGEVEHVELTTMGEARARQKDIVARIAKARAAQASAPNLAMAGVP